MRLALALLPWCLAAVAGCTSTNHGKIQEAEDANEAKVKLGITGKVAPGDRVEILKRECMETYSTNVNEPSACRSVAIGHGVVESLPNNKTAIVVADAGTPPLKPGMYVRTEKKKEAH